MVAPWPSVTLPCLSLAEFSRWIVPRVFTVVLATATPSCRTSRPASVMSPSRARIKPVLPTLPAMLSAANCGAISLPRVVEAVLPSVPAPLRMMKLSPAANWVWPRCVVIAPALFTSLPSSMT